ncbi:Hypothetical_protein [Hexamita inflata]|uniref:Hypothetical_protein n=1 Tax=Hexamita inflata TaxID=28002 RepID=A0AA86RCE4_9EUKA|nr:Hypothetical protein HINF_LOCUS59698 [Hexamita inflata]
MIINNFVCICTFIGILIGQLQQRFQKTGNVSIVNESTSNETAHIQSDSKRNCSDQLLVTFIFVHNNPGLNLDQIRNNANTIRKLKNQMIQYKDENANTITRNSPTQPKAVINKKISKTNSISPKELTESL